MMTGIIPGTLKFVEADATLPMAGGHRILVHICNNIGAWGAGFVVALAQRWPKTKDEYRRWYYAQRDFKLGNIQEVNLKSDFTVVNMIAQEGTGIDDEGNPPIRYEALKQCLDKVADLAKTNGSSVHMPRIGCGLAGSDWSQIEPIVISTLIDKGINVTVYDLPEKKDGKSD